MKIIGHLNTTTSQILLPFLIAMLSFFQGLANSFEANSSFHSSADCLEHAELETSIHLNEIDLELTMSTLDDYVTDYTHWSFTVHVNNESPNSASGVVVNIPKPEGVVYVGSNPYAASQGALNTFGTDNWQVGNLAAGATASITINYFTLIENLQGVYAQVVAANEMDIDSTPGNGNAAALAEDDESFLDVNYYVDNCQTPTVLSVSGNLGAVTVEWTLEDEGAGYKLLWTNLSTGQPTAFVNLSTGVTSYTITSTLEANVAYGFRVSTKCNSVPYIGSEFSDFYDFTVLDDNSNNSPDLTIAIDALPNAALPGELINMPYSVSNLGQALDASAFPINVKAYLSADPSLSPDDAQIGSTNFVIDVGNFSTNLLIPSGTLAGDYYLIAEVDATDQVVESNEDNNASNAAPFTVLGNNGGDEIDLAISLSQSVESPDQWSYYDVVATITNDGATMATGVEVDFKEPDGVVYVGGNSFDLSQGSFNQYTEQVWKVGALAPGATATMTAHYFSKVEVAPVSYAQVLAANETDVDSTPGNGIAPIANEDDEASTSGLGSGQADLTLSNFELPAIITKGEATPFTFTINNIGNVIADGTYTVDIFISSTPDIMIGAPQIGNVPSGYTPVGSLENVQGTVTVDQANAYIGGSIFPIDFEPGEYYLFLIADYENVIDELEETNNMISAPFTLIENPDQGVDLALSVSLSSTAPSVYSSYIATYTISNTGTEAASNIEVAIPRPADVVYVGGGAYTASAGQLDIYADVYSLDQLAAGESQTLLINYFLRGTSSQQHYAQVMAMDQEDADSSPGNGNCCTVHEDDETFVATEEIQNRRTVYELYQEERIKIMQIFPNPSYHDFVNLSLGAPAASEQVILMYDARGQEVQRSTQLLQKGFNTIQLNTADLLSGQYRIILPGAQMQRMDNAFLITR